MISLTIGKKAVIIPFGGKPEEKSGNCRKTILVYIDVTFAMASNTTITGNVHNAHVQNHGRIKSGVGGQGVRTPSEKSQKYWVSLQY